jgi:glycosyltransferase involved in cell wall biosynthesis
MKRIYCVVKAPILDSIPSLKTLLIYLAGDYKVEIITTYRNHLKLTFSHPNITFALVPERKRKLELPTSFKFFFIVLLKLKFSRNLIVIGGDTLANIFIGKLKKIFNWKHIVFQLEFPQIVTSYHPVLTNIEIQENKSLETANMIITHDKYHKSFLLEQFNLNEAVIFLLPNASTTPIHKGQSYFLQDRLKIDHDKIIALHSGGFGNSFRCKELAENAMFWMNYKLVFHTSHSMENNFYFQSVRTLVMDCSSIYFSMTPVTTDELDLLISSAKIGIALYDAHSGYRAKLMGLASGKIGNYLKCGLPVIATNLPSLEYLKEYECGILVDDESEIEFAISKILVDYKKYSDNAYNCYESLWDSKRYLEKIGQAIKCFFTK